MTQATRTATWLLGLLCSALLVAGCGGDSNAKTAPKPTTLVRTAGAVVFDDDFEFIVVEAERAGSIKGDIIKVVKDAGAWGGKCLEIPDKIGATNSKPPVYARALYKFTVRKPGNYTFWARRFWPDRCADTFFVRFDKVGKTRDELRRDDKVTQHLFGADDSSEPAKWDWSPVYVKTKGKPRQFFLDAGEHVLELLNCEDGPRLDAMVLTDDRDFVPDRGLLPEDLKD